jgi:Bacterial Ig-like domain (group 3)
MATGLVTIRANGRETARVRLTEEVHERLVPLHLAEVRINVVTVEYEGDENFLPSTSSVEVPAARGHASIAGSASRSGASVTVTIAVTGSPLTPPTGTVTVSETGALAPIEATLGTNASGRAEARVTLPGVTAGPHTFVLTYSGDARYDGATQELRFQPKSRATRH